MSTKPNLDEQFWTNRWEAGQTGWDIGYASPAIVHYVEANIPKDATILIPGAGNAYEATWLFENGWKNVTVVDISKVPIQRLKEKNPQIPGKQFVYGDFFKHTGQYDWILEQTFFCALVPHLRPAYVEKMAELVKEGGFLAGLFFNFPLTEKGPPFGGSEEEYRTRFSPYFELKKLEPATHSIKPRLGSEFAFEFQRKTGI